MGGPAKERTFRVRSVTVDVDIDIDEDLLEENGYHHEDECPSAPQSGADPEYDDTEDNLHRLSDWHDEAHGLSLWANCSQQPCRLLTDEFRRTP